MMRALSLWIIVSLLLVPGSAEAQQPGGSRTISFRYGATLHNLKRDQQVRVWVPLPRQTDAQQVEILGHSPASLPVDVQRDKVFGNAMISFELNDPSADFAFYVDFRIVRREINALQSDSNSSVSLDVSQLRPYLTASRLVPIDGVPLRVLPKIDSEQSVLQRARAIYNAVDAHVAYDKSVAGYGNGDVLWVCDSRTGNCTDFHSLFLSLSRSQKIPARFEIGFPLPAQRGNGQLQGYHCWAQFHAPEVGWVPVDISEADKHPELKEYYFGSLTENRILMTIGRDLQLVPPQKGPPLNYFVYPYAEQNGVPMDRKDLELSVFYRDLPSK